MPSFGSDTPFMLLAKLKIKEDKVAEYLEIADKKSTMVHQRCNDQLGLWKNVANYLGKYNDFKNQTKLLHTK